MGRDAAEGSARTSAQEDELAAFLWGTIGAGSWASLSALNSDADWKRKTKFLLRDCKLKKLQRKLFQKYPRYFFVDHHDNVNALFPDQVSAPDGEPDLAWLAARGEAAEDERAGDEEPEDGDAAGAAAASAASRVRKRVRFNLKPEIRKIPLSKEIGCSFTPPPRGSRRARVRVDEVEASSASSSKVEDVESLLGGLLPDADDDDDNHQKEAEEEQEEEQEKEQEKEEEEEEEEEEDEEGSRNKSEEGDVKAGSTVEGQEEVSKEVADEDEDGSGDDSWVKV